jgi:hypothetical protein
MPGISQRFSSYSRVLSTAGRLRSTRRQGGGSLRPSHAACPLQDIRSDVVPNVSKVPFGMLQRPAHCADAVRRVGGRICPHKPALLASPATDRTCSPADRGQPRRLLATRCDPSEERAHRLVLPCRWEDSRARPAGVGLAPHAVASVCVLPGRAGDLSRLHGQVSVFVRQTTLPRSTGAGLPLRRLEV